MLQGNALVGIGSDTGEEEAGLTGQPLQLAPPLQLLPLHPAHDALHARTHRAVRARLFLRHLRRASIKTRC